MENQRPSSISKVVGDESNEDRLFDKKYDSSIEITLLLIAVVFIHYLLPDSFMVLSCIVYICCNF